MTRFKIIDKKTGKEADVEDIALHEDWAKDLVYCDIEGFAITEDGELILADECGKFAYCPDGRFEIQFDAPTVEPPEWQFEWFKRMVEKTRPQGKWEEIKSNPPEFLGHRFYICSKCGREIDVITPGESLDDYPYCHCGARMIKEAENER